MPPRKTVWAVLLWAPPLLAAAGESGALTLDDCLSAALANSRTLVAADAVRAATDAKTKSVRSQGVPKVVFDAHIRRQSVVPTFKPSPLGPSIEMGDNVNYSIGPQIQWSLWDSGVRRHAAAGLAFQSAARAAERDAAAIELTWTVRRAYFQAMGAAERVRSVAEVLRLAQAQREDVRWKRDAGTASRQDWLQADAEALGRLREFLEAQADLGVALRALFVLTRETAPNLGRPLPRDTADHRPADVLPPTYVFETDDPAVLRESLTPATRRLFDANAPDLRAVDWMVRANQENATAARAGRGPAVQLLARTSRDYPNGPVHESIDQNTLGATARWSWFEGGRSGRDAEEQESFARAAAARREQAEEERRAAWAQAHDRWLVLLTEEEVQLRLVARRREIAETVQEAYRAGRAPFLEVESANTTLLNARVQGARLTVEILSQLAWIDRLSAPEVP